MDNCINFIFEMWKYKIHEKTFKFYSNFGLLGGKIVLIDLFELTDKKEKVERQIKNNGWKHLEDIAKHFSAESISYFLEQAEKRITLEKLNKYWGMKSKQNFYKTEKF